MNWWQEQWFTTLPQDVQSKYYSAYQNGFLDNNDINVLKTLPNQAHGRIQTLPPYAYKQSIKNMKKISSYNSFDRAADLGKGKTGKMPSNVIQQFTTNRLSDMAKAAKDGGGYVSVATAGLKSIPSLIKKTNSNISNIVYGKLFDCIQNKCYTKPIFENLTWKDLFATLIVLNGILMLSEASGKKIKFNITNSSLIDEIGKISSIMIDKFDRLLYDMANNFWSYGESANENIFQKITNGYITFVTDPTREIIQGLDIPTPLSIIPYVKRIVDGINLSDPNVILSSFKKYNFGRFRSGDDFNFEAGWGSGKEHVNKIIVTINHQLRQAETSFRNECLKAVLSEDSLRDDAARIETELESEKTDQVEEKMNNKYVSKTSIILDNLRDTAGQTMMSKNSIAPSINTPSNMQQPQVNINDNLQGNAPTQQPSPQNTAPLSNSQYIAQKMAEMPAPEGYDPEEWKNMSMFDRIKSQWEKGKLNTSSLNRTNPSPLNASDRANMIQQLRNMNPQDRKKLYDDVDSL